MSAPNQKTQEIAGLTPSRPYFDSEIIRKQIESVISQHGDARTAHSHIVAILKNVVSFTRKRAHEELVEDGDGRKCAQTLSMVQDALICLIYEIAISHPIIHGDKDDPANANLQENEMAIVATGGYGRGLLAPGSDIDLLFLVPSSQQKAVEALAQQMLYVLWDLGFKVGHATRNLSQAIKHAANDVTICTSMIDARFLHGNKDLFQKLTERLRTQVIIPTKSQFIDAKMSERDQRHARSGDARYMVEPNVKDGKGGLRDLHTLHWLSNAIYGEDVGQGTVNAGIFTEEEAATFLRCEDFLWTIRCFLHFITGRAEERLTFDLQAPMAESLGYKRHGGMRAVERFMKHYFLVANEVGNLTTMLCSALEMAQIKSAPRLNNLLPPLTWRKRRQVRRTTDFRFDNERLNIVDNDVFKRDPVNILRLFDEAAKADAYLHPNAIRQLRHSLRLIDKNLRNNPEANAIFLKILTGPGNPASTLRRMNDAGVLGRFILPFRRVVGMMQFNMYHHYTVDEHLIRTVEMLTDIENGGAAAELPLSTKLFSTVKNRRVLFVAALLHDIGKGRKEDHSIIGARLAADICPQLGLSKAETNLVVWLVREHLTMSNTAQSRDPSDPKTIRDLADVCKSPGRLKLLLLLTVADIRAVGPGTWNGWKGQLLRTLYSETEVLLAGGHSQEDRSGRISAAQKQLSTSLKELGWSEQQITHVVDQFYPDYWLRFDNPVHVNNAILIHQAKKQKKKFALSHTTDAFTAITEMTIFAPNHPHLSSLFAGACAAVDANILGAHITTTKDGFVLDKFLLQRKFETDEEEARLVEQIKKVIERLLKGEAKMSDLLTKRRIGKHRVEAFEVEPEIMINNGLSDNYTVIEVAGLDRPGLLYDLTSSLSDMKIDITSAHITTFGEKAVDVFYVTDLFGKKLSLHATEQALTKRLQKILANEMDEESGTRGSRH